MDNAYVLFLNILVMLLYSLPGFLLIKSKLLKPVSISSFNILLLYVTQPCLSYYTLTRVPFEKRIFVNMIYTFLITMGMMLAVIFIFRIFTKNKQKESTALRIMNISAAFGNCTFLGLPLLDALLPNYPEASVYSITFFISMSLLGWTVAAYIITGDRKYISLKKVILNPAFFGIAAALPFFLTGSTVPQPFHDAVTLVGRMSTPLCMIILGMRLATRSFKDVFCDCSKYITIALRQLAVPMLYIALCAVLPIEPNLKISIVVCGSTPVAAVVLNYCELLGEGQDYAAGAVILSNILAIVTMPLVVFIMGLVI